MDNEYETLNGVYKEIAEEFGLDIAIKFYSSFKGLNITFPMKFYNRNHVLQQIIEEFNGQNYKELARKYGYSDRWIRKILTGK